MNNVYTAVIKQESDWWIGWIEKVPGVNCQEQTRDELLESLRITLREALEFRWFRALLRPASVRRSPDNRVRRRGRFPTRSRGNS